MSLNSIILWRKPAAHRARFAHGSTSNRPSPRASKGRKGRQKGVKYRPFQVTRGHCRTLENASWPGTIVPEQV